MKRNFRETVFLLLILGVPIVPAMKSYAQPIEEKSGWEEKKAKWEEKRKEMMKGLGLTEDQDKQLQAHREKHRSAMKDVYKQISEKRDEIKLELQKTDFNLDSVKRIHEELKALKNKMEDMRLEGILEVRKVLTQDQFNKFVELKKKFYGRGHHGKGMEEGSEQAK